jgi:serine/threonine protein kinase
MAHKFEIISKLGEGEFGAVFLGKRCHSIDDNDVIALKFEYNSSPFKMLKHETKIIHYLYEKGCKKIPSVFWFGLYNNHLCMAMSYYKMSFEEYIQTDQLHQNSKNTEYYFYKMIEIMEHVHDKYVIHCDIKPANFMICKDELYLIDFGLAKIYVNDENTHVCDTKSDDSILGTPKYISIYIHQGHSPSRRDDIISCVYIYLFSKMKTLPWENIPDSTENIGYLLPSNLLYYKNQIRMTIKQDTNRVLHECNLGKLLNKIYSIDFDQRPSYSIYREWNLLH